MNEISTQPEILFTALTGPGTFFSRPGYEKIVCSVYSYHPTLYLGYPGLIPKIDNAAAKKTLTNVPIIGKHISDIRIVHDSDFILRCHFGEFWLVMALCSGVFEAFTEGGKFLRQSRHLFFSQETIQEWMIVPHLKKNINPEVALKILVAEKIVSGNTSIQVNDLDMKSFDEIIGSPSTARKRADAVIASSGFKALQKRMSEKEINALLIAIRLFI
jgi:hypothetical protein